MRILFDACTDSFSHYCYVCTDTSAHTCTDTSAHTCTDSFSHYCYV